MERGEHQAKRKREKKEPDYSKTMISDMRGLLWTVTVGGLLLALLCILKDYMGALPWLSAMVGLPWTAWGTVASFYLNMAKSDHKEGGITHDAAAADNYGVGSDNSPPI